METIEESPIILKSQTYGVPEGLSQSTVTSIVEDKDGYVWFGTLNGLNRFDGTEFKVFLADGKSGLPSSFIRSLFVDSSGRLLIGTDKGLAEYNYLKEVFIQVLPKQEAINVEIWSIAEGINNLFLGTNNGVIKIDFNLASILEKNINRENFEVKKIVTIGDNVFIRTYDKSLYELKNGTYNKIEQNIYDIEKFGDSLYFSSQNGLFTLNPEPINISAQTFELLSSSQDSLYGVNNKSIYSINKQKHLGDIENLEQNNRKSFFYAAQKNLIIGIESQGVEIISESRNLIKSTSLLKDNIWHISRTNDDIIISSDSEHIKTYNTDLKEVNTYNSGIIGNKNTIKVDDTLYIATHRGLYTALNKDEKPVLLLDGNITTLNNPENTQLVLAGTSNGEVIFIRNGIEDSRISIGVNYPVLEILFISKDEIYIASQGGLFAINSENSKTITNTITYTVKKYKENILFGTATSLMMYDKKTKKTKSVYSNGKDIYSIIPAKDSVIASSIGEVVITNLEHDFILSTDYGSQYEYNTQSGISFNDTVLIGGMDGISLLSTSSIKEYISSLKPLKTELSSLSIFNIDIKGDGKYFSDSFNSSKKITLKSSEYPFTFKFISPMSSPKKRGYYYRLAGLSDDWISSNGGNSATYTNLSPGTYEFQVYAVDSLTNTQGPIKSIQVEIPPPWWLSIQAKVIYFIIILLVLLAITKAIMRRRETQKQIAQSEERLKLSLWGSGDEMWDWDIETGEIYRSNIWGSLDFPKDGQRAGLPGEESNIHPMDQDRVREALNCHFHGKTDHFEAAYRVKGKNDEWIWILDRAKIVERNLNDNPLRMTGTIKNINGFKHAEEQLRLFERAIENISEGMFILDSQFQFVEVNQACCEITQNTRDAFLGQQLHFKRYPDSFSRQVLSMLKLHGRWSNEVESTRGDGSAFLMELTIDAIYDDQGELSHFVGVFSDISRRKQQEEELRKLTNNDLLTGLPNRSNLQVTLSNLVKKDSHHTLMVLDLDNFKKINDSLGHQVGDELLRQIARRIEPAVPSHAGLYRLGGDEFAILIDQNPDIGSSAAVANRIIEIFRTPFEIAHEKLVIGVSIGIVLYPEDEQNEQALLRKADIAMYHAKSAGGNRYQFYSESLNRNAIRQLEVENLIRDGLRDDLFEVYYQPKVDLKRGRIAGMEALVRLNHPQQGLISPIEFIPLAEETGLIVEIGDIVLKKACFAAQQWREQGIFDGRVAVNLSSRQFSLADLQQRIESILRLTKLPPTNLELEITEGTVIKHPEKAIKVMQQLSKMGISLALDDFGTGYSSLSYLKRFPIHTLKIDKAFVDDIDKSDRDLKMVDSIITIAHNMGLSVVGEGVEDNSQLSILRALKCEEIQGYIFSKPVSEAHFTQLLLEDMQKVEQAHAQACLFR